VEAPKRISLRDSFNVDVYARDDTQPPHVIFVECKNWGKKVPQSVVHCVRSQVADGGANTGMIVSRHGFQTGAHQAAKQSNILLLGWEGFQRMFVDRWYTRYMAPQLSDAAGPLLEYTEPVNSRILRKTGCLPGEKAERLLELRKRHYGLGAGLMPLWHDPFGGAATPPRLPLRTTVSHSAADLPPDVLDAAALRPLMDELIVRFADSISEFDEIFGEAAWRLP
jgi:hypothetical protein